MEIINLIIGTPLGYLLWFCYLIFRNFGLAIVVFAVLIKAIMLPLSLWVQRNSIKMIRLKPALNRIEARYCTDRDRMAEEQLKLYKQENYKPLAGTIPMLIQIPLILGILSVVYHPLQHMLHLDSAIIDTFSQAAMEILHLPEAGASLQLRIVELIANPAYTAVFSELPVAGAADAVERILSLDMNFLGINLSHTPSLAHADALLLVPLLSGLSALFLSWCQNKLNVLQKEAGWFSRWGIAILLSLFSLYFAYIVPAGVGLYWIAGNLLAVLVLLICNAVYPPKKNIDYAALEQSKEALKKAKAYAAVNRITRAQMQQAKADYKRFLDPGNRKSIVIYSEKSGFYKYFQAVIDALLQKSNLDIHYVTSDPNDIIFWLNEPRIKPYFIDDKRLILLFMQLDADIMVMTMPDLGTYHLKRSYVRKDIEYIYIYHGVTNSHMVARKGCLDHFDTILCVGPHQVREAREAEALYGLPARRLVECGYPLIENAAREYEVAPHALHDKKRIVIAPSWQEDNLLDTCLDELLRHLLCEQYTVYLRPHPQYLRHHPEWAGQVQETYHDFIGNGLELQTDFSQSVFEADLLITDWSTVAYEYSFATKKPCLFVNTPPKIMNGEYTRYALVPVDITWREEVGRSIDCDQLDHVRQYVLDLLEHSADYAQKLERMRNECLFHYGHSSEAACDYILSSLAERNATVSILQSKETPTA